MVCPQRMRAFLASLAPDPPPELSIQSETQIAALSYITLGNAKDPEL